MLQAVATELRTGEAHILAAMDGLEGAKPDQTPTTKRKEPTLFFYVLFGLVYEALATSSADASSASSSRQAEVISSLQALQCLVRPEYSGEAMLEPTIFEEFIALCYRMGMTEAPAVQTHLVDMLATFAASHIKEDSDALTMTSPISHCLRICAHVMKQTTAPRSITNRGSFCFSSMEMLLISYDRNAISGSG